MAKREKADYEFESLEDLPVAGLELAKDKIVSVAIKHLKARPSKLRKVKTPERDMKFRTPERDCNLSER